MNITFIYLIMRCVSCNCADLNDKSILSKYLDKIIISDICRIITEYILFKPLRVLHTYRENDRMFSHSICDDCKTTIVNRMLMCDTPLLQCPVCPRMLYMG